MIPTNALQALVGWRTIVKDNHLEHILEKKTSEVFTTDVLSALLER